MMDRFAALDGAIVHGGRIRLRAGLGARQLAGVDTRAGVLALLLARPIGYTVHGLQAETGMSTGVLESALAGLTIECPALYEYQHGRAWYIAIDRDTWRRSGWYAGSVTRGPRDETEDEGEWMPRFKLARAMVAR